MEGKGHNPFKYGNIKLSKGSNELWCKSLRNERGLKVTVGKDKSYGIIKRSEGDCGKT